MLCWPLLRRHGSTGASRKAINTAIYRDQLAELERDLASGVLSQADYGSARDELERRVLEDVAADATTAAPASPRRLPRTALALAVTLPLAAAVLYVVLGTPAALDPAAREGQQASAAEIEKMVDALAAKLEKDPGNLEGWAMLGRSYMVTGRFADAAKAFDKAGSAMEVNSEMMLQVAELSAELNQGRVEGRGRELVDCLGFDHALQDIRSAAAHLQDAGKVGVVGYCWGGTAAYLANTRLSMPAVSYYGARTVPYLDEQLDAPMQFHFGDRDPSIPAEDVALHRERHPDAEVHVYPAGHGFNCDQRADYDRASATLALERTLSFFQRALHPSY